MTINDSVIIFHRSRQGSEEDLINQQAFLESNKKALASVKIISYMSGDYDTAVEIMGNTKEISKKLTVIFNSSLTESESYLQYDLGRFFETLQKMGLLSIYLMDSKGRLYKEVKTVEL